MPKKTLRVPCKVPSERKCCECGKSVKRRDVTAGNAKQLAEDIFICSYCALNIEPESSAGDKKEQAPRKLAEIQNVRQISGEPPRRWFTNGPIDLIVWLDGSRLYGFQLVVPSDDGQTAVTWRKEGGLSVAGVDDGEGRPYHPKMTPVLTMKANVDIHAVLKQFEEVSDDLPLGLADFVETRISRVGRDEAKE